MSGGPDVDVDARNGRGGGDGATYVCFLRGINVGGNSIVSMAALKATFIRVGLTDVRTFINSGNVIFSAEKDSAGALARRIETAIRDDLGMTIPCLVLSATAFQALADAIPQDWSEGDTHRCNVLLLWAEVDTPSVLEQLPIQPTVDEVLYVPGAVLWRYARANASRSRLNRLVGTDLYKKMSIRNTNTIRRIEEIVGAR
ncbi:MAG: DUF1697 domain-containing protein [Candidatus Dormibacteraeota bacterium]|nr:DUF1697 domain-containing protein [Candidatus Dormibacteraeota bacterium]